MNKERIIQNIVEYIRRADPGKREMLFAWSAAFTQKRLKDLNIIETVTGHGKGMFRIKEWE